MIRSIRNLWSYLELAYDPFPATLQFLAVVILLAVQPSVAILMPNYPLHQVYTRKETVDRLHSLFGVGWFFEWPGGRHPLNSTWPWADVKPSLLVLWGVCWMFIMALPVGMSRSSSQPSPLSHHPRAFSSHPHTYCYCCGPARHPDRHRYCKLCILLHLSPRYHSSGRRASLFTSNKTRIYSIGATALRSLWT